MLASTHIQLVEHAPEEQLPCSAECTNMSQCSALRVTAIKCDCVWGFVTDYDSAKATCQWCLQAITDGDCELWPGSTNVWNPRSVLPQHACHWLVLTILVFHYSEVQGCSKSCQLCKYNVLMRRDDAFNDRVTS